MECKMRVIRGLKFIPEVSYADYNEIIGHNFSCPICNKAEAETLKYGLLYDLEVIDHFMCGGCETVFILRDKKDKLIEASLWEYEDGKEKS